LIDSGRKADDGVIMGIPRMFDGPENILTTIEKWRKWIQLVGTEIEKTCYGESLYIRAFHLVERAFEENSM